MNPFLQFHTNQYSLHTGTFYLFLPRIFNGLMLPTTFEAIPPTIFPPTLYPEDRRNCVSHIVTEMNIIKYND